MSTFPLANLPNEVLRNLPLDTATTLNMCRVNKFFSALLINNIYRNVEFERDVPLRICRFAKTIAAKPNLGASVESFKLCFTFLDLKAEVEIDQTDVLTKSQEGRTEIKEGREYVTLARE